ncbi:MAG: tetratricopeptide repeat protein [Chitinophagaceae bacterium]|nr:tetratricopeptide repeat protein [Chitinophagaceae bacterium]
MNRVKKGLFLMTLVVLGNGVFAQTIDEGRKQLYYEKYISARNVFQKLVGANPADADAVYWLGQTLIAPDEDKDVAGAKALYQTSLALNSNSALLIAGMGHLELLEGRTQDARNRFETAISLSNGKSIPVLNAVGFANADFDSKLGDAGYAIEKLKQAVALKGMKDPDVYVNLGDAYRKMADGGNAQLSYEAALALKPDYARAKYRIGRIYQTQGVTQEDIYMKYYNEAIAMDPNYTPVYWTLHQYFYETNVGRSAEFLEKYLAAKGSDEPNACFLRAQMKYAQGLFQDAITRSDECIASGGANPYPNLYGIKAYAYNKIGDSGNAKLAFDQYFMKQKPAKIGPSDYKTYAEVLLKFPGNESLAGTFIDKAVELDSTEAGKVALLKSVASSYEKQKSFIEAANWYKKVFNVKKNVSKTDYYNAGYNYFRTGQFQQSADVFSLYTQKYPDDIFGYYMIGKSYWGIDTTMSLSMANPSFEKAIQVGEAYPDKSKISAQLIGCYKYMIAYFANVKKDKPGALTYCNKTLLINPNDQEVLGNKDAISKMNMNAPPPRPATNVPQKPKQNAPKPGKPKKK